MQLKKLLIIGMIFISSFLYADDEVENTVDILAVTTEENAESVTEATNENFRKLNEAVKKKVEGLSDMGVTSSASELNILDGATLSTAELNYVDGTDSNIQDQIDALTGTIGTFAFGSYSGTGSSVNVEFGFRPDMVEIFRSSDFITWWVDEEHDGTGAGFHGANGSAGSGYTVTFDSEGFNTTGAGSHTNGVKYYYKAYST